MMTLIIALGSLALYLLAYHTYGKWLGRKIFRLTAETVVPSIELEDGNDYVPTSKGIVFGHHFTSSLEPVKFPTGSGRTDLISATAITGRTRQNNRKRIKNIPKEPKVVAKSKNEGT